ncbi:MAG: hypothetical protein H2184_15670 [Candidatus Galacturonibacter soehngenii]|nr:hypothetical protein [Candidatus Galacturonibacter soehngenii]
MESFDDVEVVYPNKVYAEQKKLVSKWRLIALLIVVISGPMTIFLLNKSYYFQDNNLLNNLFCVLGFISAICCCISFFSLGMNVSKNIIFADKIKNIRIHAVNIYKEKSMTEFILVDENDVVTKERIFFLEFVYKIEMDKPLLNLEESKLYLPYEN